MTLSTVGYGDISPNTTEEKIFTIVVIFTGVSGYAMLIQAIGTAMAGDPNKLSHTKAMRNYLYDYEVPPDLAKRILHFLRLRASAASELRGAPSCDAARRRDARVSPVASPQVTRRCDRSISSPR